MKTNLKHIFLTLALIALAFVTLSVTAAVSAGGTVSPVLCTAVMCVVYLVLAIVLTVVYNLIRARIAGAEPSRIPSGNGLSVDILSNLYLPSVICDEAGQIVWFNTAFAALAPRGLGSGVPFSRYCPMTLDELLASPEPDGAECEALGAVYRIRAMRLTNQNKSYIFTVWNDCTKLKQALRDMSSAETMVAYIIIDNLSELLQYMQDKYSSASADVEKVIREWAEEAGGVLKEYERDKFIFFFSAEKLSDFIESKFDILDRIREIRIGDIGLPVTVSIGVSNVGGTLAEKERAAHASLDMALQRGGDQAVVRTDSGLDFFGGRTKTMQRRTKVRSRVVANELLAHIAESSNVLVMGHRGADFDSLGACVGIARLADFCGVPVNIVCNPQDPSLAKSFEKLRRTATDPDRFLDGASAQDLIRPSTLLVVVDVNNRRQFEAADIYDNAPRVALIDHHRKTEEFTRPLLLTYLEPSASSTCELVSEILEQVLPAGLLPKDEADMMFAGILVDTKQFARNAGTRTFSAALFLRSEGANPADAQELFRTELDDLIREAKFESRVMVYRGNIAITVNDDDGNQPSDRVIAAKAADKLLTVEGVEASFALVRIDGTVCVSARSSGGINVQLIAERLGGGGHFDGAAAQLKDTDMGQALKLLKDAIDEFI